jgi:hypothetical protein
LDVDTETKKTLSATVRAQRLWYQDEVFDLTRTAYTGILRQREVFSVDRHVRWKQYLPVCTTTPNVLSNVLRAERPHRIVHS